MSGATEVLDQLDALHAAATTSEPWINDSHELYREMPGLPGITGPWIGETCDIDNLPGSEANATLIVAAVNAVPQLTAALRTVLRLADQWAALEHWDYKGPEKLARARADSANDAARILREHIAAALGAAEPQSASPA